MFLNEKVFSASFTFSFCLVDQHLGNMVQFIRECLTHMGRPYFFQKMPDIVIYFVMTEHLVLFRTKFV